MPLSKPKKIIIVVLSLIVLCLIGGYVFLRYDVLKAKDYKVDVRKEETPLDLRPAIIAKLQQVVKDGSDGLYILSIDSLNPDVAASTVDATGVRLDIDTAAFNRLNAAHLLPDDVFKLRLSSMHIAGFGIEDLLHKKTFSVSGISITSPVIEAFHHKRAYNQDKRDAKKQLTLYQKIKQGMDKIAIGKVRITNATFIDHNMAAGNKTSTFKSISIALDDILVDSASQYDTNRMLFAKATAIESKAYSLPTPDSMYEVKISSISISGPAHNVILKGLEMRPRGGKQAYISRLKMQKEMFDLSFPTISLSGISWWALLHGEQMIATDAHINGGRVYVYLDKRLPPNPTIKMANFPQQLFVALKLPIAIDEVHLSGVDLTYEEFNPKVKEVGAITLNNMSVTVSNMTNIPARIAKDPTAVVAATCLFMNQSRMTTTFRLSLQKQKQGAFVADVSMTDMDHTLANRFAEPMAMVTLPSGHMQKGSAHIEGNNHRINGKVSIAYTDLHITPLKPQKDADGDLKHKHVTGFIANLLLIKNNNPGRNGEFRQPDITLGRGKHGNIFNLTWSGIKLGMLKTIGIPPKMVMKDEQP